MQKRGHQHARAVLRPQPLTHSVEPGAFLLGVQIDLDKLEVSNKTVRMSVTIPQRGLALIDRATRSSPIHRGLDSSRKPL